MLVRPSSDHWKDSPMIPNEHEDFASKDPPTSHSILHRPGDCFNAVAQTQYNFILIALAGISKVDSETTFGWSRASLGFAAQN